MRDNVYLVGFMGAGKTCVGRRLAEMLSYGFVDLDGRIEEMAGERIRAIFVGHGEQFFRNLETEELQKVSTLRRYVVALGGGAFCSEQNRKMVRASGTSVWLDAPASTLYQRCAGDDSRPLFGTRPDVEALLSRRREFYEKADLKVPVQDRTVDEIALEIVNLLRK